MGKGGRNSRGPGKACSTRSCALHGKENENLQAWPCLQAPNPGGRCLLGWSTGGEIQKRLQKTLCWPPAPPRGLLPRFFPPRTQVFPVLPPKHVSQASIYLPFCLGLGPSSVAWTACHSPLHQPISKTVVKVILLQSIMFFNPIPFKCLSGSL